MVCFLPYVFLKFTHITQGATRAASQSEKSCYIRCNMLINCCHTCFSLNTDPLILPFLGTHLNYNHISVHLFYEEMSHPSFFAVPLKPQHLCLLKMLLEVPQNHFPTNLFNLFDEVVSCTLDFSGYNYFYSN